jgi:hypothetical protein
MTWHDNYEERGDHKFFYASHPGTTVISVYEHTPTPHIPHSHPMYTYRPYNYTRFEDRVLKKITETIQVSVDDRHVTVSLQLQAREAAPVKYREKPR